MNYQLNLTNDKKRIDNHFTRSYVDCNWNQSFDDYRNEISNFMNERDGKLLEFENEIGGTLIYDIKKFNSIAIGCLWISKSMRGKKLPDLVFSYIEEKINTRIYFFCLEHLVDFYRRKNFKEIFLNESNCYLMSNYQTTEEICDYVF